MKKFLCAFLCIMMISMSLVSCSRPPELSAVLPRLAELIEASYGVNDLLFGKGPETYPRVYDPSESAKPYYDEGNNLLGHYRYIEDEQIGTILAYNTKSSGKKYTYLKVTDTKNDTDECVYRDEEKGLYYIKIEYTEKEYDFYYTDDIPSDYDVIKVSQDNPYQSIESIKKYAETVYSKEYLEGVYGTVFDGAVVSHNSTGYIKARYVEHRLDNGDAWFLISNEYESVSTEKRIFDLDSAKMLRGSNKEYVKISVDSYLESKPAERLTVTLSMVLQDGVWMLDAPTY